MGGMPATNKQFSMDGVDGGDAWIASDGWGDYAAGPSHVLPTGGTARWAAGLSANSFLRSNSVIEFSRHALNNIAPHIQRLADKEGLTAHRATANIDLTASTKQLELSHEKRAWKNVCSLCSADSRSASLSVRKRHFQYAISPHAVCSSSAPYQMPGSCAWRKREGKGERYRNGVDNR